ncbi:MAG: hypothetical protein Q605_AUC00738G0005 [Actinomyces urogenitalis DORA_12]|uniref:Uncharacterized protein n=1 Tax=Actinomyces urogenitalis DORA_12 TaxID=1403939 RepID=W1VDN8_9ACTO|nr:MAG: hypothetical protein Q605_AUC00738G0005 [Actinomyces urogenitalis DORA_12]
MTVAVTVVRPGLTRRSSEEEPSAAEPPTIQDTADAGAQAEAVRPLRSPEAVEVVTSPVAEASESCPGARVRTPPTASSVDNVESSSRWPP